jgi:hypothetical protein
MPGAFKVYGENANADFTLAIHRGEGMALLAMNWRHGQPPADFVGFAIEYREPGNQTWYSLKNRLTFNGNAGSASSADRPSTYSTLEAPIQKFRWVHFPRNAQLAGAYDYRVTPIAMAPNGTLSRGQAQTASIELADETYPDELNIAFTRGFVSSQAFVDKFKQVDALLPAHSVDSFSFTATAANPEAAYAWMGFEARRLIIDTLKAAIADLPNGDVDVGIVAYDFDLPELVDLIIQLKGHVRVIIDNSDGHSGPKHAEDEAERRLEAGGISVLRQHMTTLQHNKTIYVDGPTVKRAICGSTNMSWRGFYVQSNNAVVIEGDNAVAIVKDAFETYWSDEDGFSTSPSVQWIPFGLPSVDVSISFSPHTAATARLKAVAKDVRAANSSVFYSLAFLWQTPGDIRNALQYQTARDAVFVAGISEKATAIEVAAGSTNEAPVSVQPLDDTVPFPFRPEPSGLVDNSAGTRMHHKFIVLDFNTPDARVYTGSYNMSLAADTKNGENLLLIRDRRVATSYMIEAIRMIDHYEFRVAQKNAATARKTLMLQRPPAAGQPAWWAKDWIEPHRIADRLLFSA